MGRPEKYTVAIIEEELRKTLGAPALAAENLGCSYNTVARYISKSPKLQAIVEHFRERRVDKAELKLEAAIQGGESWAIALVLKTLGKNRGYVERQELTGADAAAVTVRVLYGDQEEQNGSAS